MQECHAKHVGLLGTRGAGGELLGWEGACGEVREEVFEVKDSTSRHDSLFLSAFSPPILPIYLVILPISILPTNLF